MNHETHKYAEANLELGDEKVKVYGEFSRPSNLPDGRC